jgi:predicted PurR-regulated permease PerM
MDIGSIQKLFLATLLVAASVLVFFIVKPLFAPLLLAAVFATLFQPLFRQIRAAMPKFPSIAALLTVILVTAFVGVVLGFLINHLLVEAQSLYLYVSTSGNVLSIIPEPLLHLINTYAPIGLTSADITTYVQNALAWLLGNFGTLFSGAAHIALTTLVFAISLYYFLRDGDDIVRVVIATSPLPDRDDEKIIERLRLATNSVLRGSLMVALIQGVLSTIGYTIFGIPNPIIWGSLTALSALIPGLGTSIVIVPAVLYLYFQGQTTHAIGLLAWGAVAVGLIDNFIGPRLMGHGIRMHPLLMLVSVLGGLAFFGPIGFLAGPLSVSVFITILRLVTERSRV